MSLLLLAWLPAAWATAPPDPAPAAAEPVVKTGARVGTALRLFFPCGTTIDGCPLGDFRDAVVFGPWLEARPGSGLIARAAVDLRLHPRTTLGDFEELGEVEAIQGISLKLREAWVGHRGEVVDLSMGARTLAWGTGLGISVANELQPYDLENPGRFDQRLPTALVEATLHRGAWSLQGAVQPLFVPALLPTNRLDLTAGAEDLFDAEATGAGEVELVEAELRPALPAPSLDEATLGARLRWTPAWGDVALSWVHGRDSLPQVDGEVILTGFQTDTDLVQVGVPLTFPRRDVGALELRTTPWGEVGAWGELALVLPASTAATTSLAQLTALERLGTIEEVPDPLPTTVTQDGAPFLRWLLGVDRQLGPVTLAAQWLHGFPTERQAADLGDYALLNLRYLPLPDLRLDLGLVGQLSGPGAPGWGIVDGGITALLADQLELGAGLTLVNPQAGDSLAAFQDISHLRLTAGLQF